MLTHAIQYSLDELIGLLAQLSDRQYTQRCSALSEATIGQHTRHVIEMFQCLDRDYDFGRVNYDKRERNPKIETSTAYAAQMITEIKQSLGRPDKSLVLEQCINGQPLHIQSNYDRELLYNLEHCIHHQALIKVALVTCPQVMVDDHFGVARSTIEYRKQCAP